MISKTELSKFYDDNFANIIIGIAMIGLFIGVLGAPFMIQKMFGSC